MASYAGLFTGETPAASGPQPEKKRYRLLFVDDEPNILKALLRVFRQEHYVVDTAPNGEAAVALLRANEYQLIVTDFMMPGMNGGELLEHAKTIRPDALRIMLTGHANTQAVMAAINSGAVYRFILKPWNDDDLRVSVALALEQYDLMRKNRALKHDNEAKSKEINVLGKLASGNRSQLAIMLHKRNMLNNQQVQEVYRLQQTRKEPVIAVLLEKGWVAEKAIRDILVKELLVEEVALAEFQVDQAVAALLPRVLCQRQIVMPLKVEGRRLLLAVADPLDTGLIDDLRFTVGMEVRTALAKVADIRAKIKEVYGGDAESIKDLETLVGDGDPFEGIEIVLDEQEDEVSIEDLLHGTEEPPAIRLVNAIILEAIRLGASDIHIQPRTKNVGVRYRIDGILVEKIQVPLQYHQALVSRLKVMAELDISERRRPQDGRLTLKTPTRIVDMRISTLPTINGEKIVMRILERNSPVLHLDSLGFAPRDLAQISRVVDKPQGIILATGPTGSGKTTTLYSLLQHNATPARNYVTIEDPVEYYMDAAGQVLIREKIGLTFPLVLRAILRQDPDTILLGEIRDLETAEVAFHAALTGHQVFSTLHTNSAIATISRLLDLGLKPYVIATALECIVAQRLVRHICPECRTPATPDPAIVSKLGESFDPAKLASFRGEGCPACHNTGYHGRLGLYEVLVPDEELRHQIATGASILEIRASARRLGATTLLDDAIAKVRAGLTTVEEVFRVLGPQ